MTMQPRTQRERRHPYRINRRIVQLLDLALAEAEKSRGADQERIVVLLRAAVREIRREVEGRTA